MKDETILLRQGHPSFVEDGETTSQAFFPFPKDEQKLSVDDGDLTTPEAAFEFYTKVRKLESVGTWGISCTEVASTGLQCGPDALPDNPAHAAIDFANLNEKACRKLARKLKAFANERTRLHPVS